MSVLFFTIFVSLVLALFFVGAFLYHHDYSGGDSMRDSLLPFQKETARPPAPDKTSDIPKASESPSAPSAPSSDS